MSQPQVAVGVLSADTCLRPQDLRRVIQAGSHSQQRTPRQPRQPDGLKQRLRIYGEDNVTKDINVLALVKGGERYIFLYNDTRKAETLRTLGRFASNPELNFSWYDAAVLSQKVRKTAQRSRSHDPRVFKCPTACSAATASFLSTSSSPRAIASTATAIAASPCKQLSSDFLRYLEVERNASALTIKSYREDLEALLEYLEESAGRLPKPREISTFDLRGYVAALTEADYAKSSIARHLATLRSFFRFAQREELVDHNPAKPLRNPRKSRKLPHFLSTDELGRLLQAPPAESALGLRDRAILETMYSAGLRVSELVGINDGDIDLDGGTIRVRGKGRRERLAPVGSYARKAIRRWLGQRQLAKDAATGSPRPPSPTNSAGG